MPEEKKLYFVTDVEATGPDFATMNMYQFASVPVTQEGDVMLGTSFNLEFSTDKHYPDTLKFLKKDLGITPESWMARDDLVHPAAAMTYFKIFIEDALRAAKAEKPIFLADNLAFDWGYIHVYFFRYLGLNPFGYAGRNMPDISLGRYKSRSRWEDFATEEHTHDAFEDTRGNAGALGKMIKRGFVME